MQRAYRYAISASCVAALGALAVAPESMWVGTSTVCLFRNLMDVECFGCGMTRALSAALHGHFEAALDLNRGVVLAGPALIAGAMQALWR